MNKGKNPSRCAAEHRSNIVKAESLEEIYTEWRDLVVDYRNGNIEFEEAYTLALEINATWMRLTTEMLVDVNRRLRSATSYEQQVRVATQYNEWLVSMGELFE